MKHYTKDVKGRTVHTHKEEDGVRCLMRTEKLDSAALELVFFTSQLQSDREEVHELDDGLMDIQ